jgi:predicted dehydrogenase
VKAGRIRAGVVGCGIWGQMHVRAYLQHPSADLVGVCDQDRARATATARQFGIAKAFTDLDDLLNEKLDTISVATPDDSHAEIAIKAAHGGVHVLVEKPLAGTLDECRRMIAAAKKSHVYLMVDWHNRWNPPYHEAWKSIREGELGDLTYIYYRLSDTIYVPTKMLPWAGKSSVLLFLGSHAMDTTCWLMGAKPVRIWSQRKEGLLTAMGISTADMYLSIVDFENGATAVIENSWVLPQSSPSLIDHKCEIIGSKGVIYIDPTHCAPIAKYTAKTPAGFPHSAYPDMFITPQIHGRQLGFSVETIYHFIERVRDKKEPLTSGEDGLLNTRLILAAEKSAQTGKPVRV